MARYSAKESEQLRKHILEVAVRMIRADGIAHLTMRKLAIEASVSQTTPYNMFVSKGQLLVEILTADFLNDITQLKSVFDPSCTIEELFNLLDIIEAIVLDKEEFVKSLFVGIMQNLVEVNSKPLTDIIEYFAMTWISQKVNQRWLSEHTDIQSIAKVITSTLGGHLLLWSTNSIPSSHICLQIKYSFLSALSDCISEEHSQSVQVLLKDIMGEIKKIQP